jgi:hypothetical protein
VQQEQQEQQVPRCWARPVLVEQQASLEWCPCRQRIRSSRMERRQRHIRNLLGLLQRHNRSLKARHCNRSLQERHCNRN